MRSHASSAAARASPPSAVQEAHGAAPAAACARTLARACARSSSTTSTRSCAWSGSRPYARASSPVRRTPSRWSGWSGRAPGACSGAHSCAATARSHSGRPGAASAKSMRATTCPSRKTTFSGNRSSWHTTGPPRGSAHSCDQPLVEAWSKSAVASWKRRRSRPRSSSAVSVSAHGGYGGSGTSPSTNVRTSRPRSSTPRERGAPSNPTASRCSSSARTAADDGPAGRRTVSPTRTRPAPATRPALVGRAQRPLDVREAVLRARHDARPSSGVGVPNCRARHRPGASPTSRLNAEAKAYSLA